MVSVMKLLKKLKGVSMKLSSLLCILALLAGFASCSGSKSTTEVEQMDAGIELSDAEEFIEDDSFDDIADGLEEELGTEPVMGAQEPIAPSETLADSTLVQEPVEQIQLIGGETAQYTVEKNETLMMIAFKIYGDYGRWKEIASANSDKLGSSFNIREGMTLSYTKPTEEFRWTPSGNPYLIKPNDTLGTISKDTYGVQKYWKNIWDNNKPLIKDPNIIFAGFTIYTPELEARTLANE